jgi:hypothetical protein
MRNLILAVLAQLVFCINAHAEDNGIYVGGALSRSTIDTNANLFGFSFEDDDTAYKLIAGIRPFDAISFEANYIDFGNIVFDNRAVVSDGFRSELQADAIDALVVGYVGGPAIELFGKLGVVFWDAEAVLQGGIGGVDIRDSDSGTDLVYGGGVQAQFGSLAVRLEYEGFDVASANTLELWSLGLTWTFF